MPTRVASTREPETACPSAVLTKVAPGRHTGELRSPAGPEPEQGTDDEATIQKIRRPGSAVRTRSVTGSGQGGKSRVSVSDVVGRLDGAGLDAVRRLRSSSRPP